MYISWLRNHLQRIYRCSLDNLGRASPSVYTQQQNFIYRTPTQARTASPEWTDNIQRRLQWHRPPHAPPCISPLTQPPSSGMSDVRQYGRHDGNTHDDARRRDTVLVGTRGGGGARVAFVTWTIRGLAPVNHPNWSLAGRTVYRRWLIAVAFELLMQEPRSGENMEAKESVGFTSFLFFKKVFHFDTFISRSPIFKLSAWYD